MPAWDDITETWDASSRLWDATRFYVVGSLSAAREGSYNLEPSLRGTLQASKSLQTSLRSILAVQRFLGMSLRGVAQDSYTMAAIGLRSGLQISPKVSTSMRGVKQSTSLRLVNHTAALEVVGYLSTDFGAVLAENYELSLSLSAVGLKPQMTRLDTSAYLLYAPGCWLEPPTSSDAWTAGVLKTTNWAVDTSGSKTWITENEVPNGC